MIAPTLSCEAVVSARAPGFGRTPGRHLTVTCLRLLVFTLSPGKRLSTPGTTGTIRRPDRLLAVQLYERGVPLMVIENALLLAAAGRLIRPVESPLLNTIRSLAYFVPVIEEVTSLRVSPDYFQYLRQKFARHAPAW